MTTTRHKGRSRAYDPGRLGAIEDGREYATAHDCYAIVYRSVFGYHVEYQFDRLSPDTVFAAGTEYYVINSQGAVLEYVWNPRTRSHMLSPLSPAPRRSRSMAGEAASKSLEGYDCRICWQDIVEGEMVTELPVTLRIVHVACAPYA